METSEGLSCNASMKHCEVYFIELNLTIWKNHLDQPQMQQPDTLMPAVFGVLHWTGQFIEYRDRIESQ